MSGTYPETDGLQTGGHAGGATSEERARREAQDGTLSARLSGVLVSVAARHAHGMTVKEVRTSLGLHHGQASSALTNLHRVGSLARLTERRDGCFVYVLTDYVVGRETQPPGHVRGGGGETHIVEVKPPLSGEDASLVRVMRREFGSVEGDPSALLLIEAGQLADLLRIIEERS